MVSRIKTHVEGFDKIVKGGLPKNSAILVTGQPGTGKTIFCLQTLYNNASKGKKVLFISLQMSENDLKNQMSSFGWKIDSKTKKNFNLLCLTNEGGSTVHKILTLIKNTKPEIIALDSLASIFMRSESKEEFNLSMEEINEKVVPIMLDPADKLRSMVHNLINQLKTLNTTSLLISEVGPETNALSRDQVSEYETDGIVILKALAVGKTLNRTLQVSKMRITEADCGIKSFSITKKGIELD